MAAAVSEAYSQSSGRARSKSTWVGGLDYAAFREARLGTRSSRPHVRDRAVPPGLKDGKRSRMRLARRENQASLRGYPA
jgi:hypothetical protein